MALCLLLTGCNQGGDIIVLDDPDEAAAAYDMGQSEVSLDRPGYYAPNADIQGDSPVVPAPATLDEIRQAAQQAAQEQDYERASIFTDIAKGDLNMGLVVGDIQSINPLRCTHQDMMNLNTLVYEGLMKLDENMKPVPDLADRWEVSGDIWTFTLRGNVQFHDGSLLTPDDVLASYEELTRNSGSYWYPMLSMIKGMRKVNENTIAVQGVSGGYMVLYAMTFPIVQRNSMEQDAPVGTGPYLISRYDVGNAVRLELNPNWWKRHSEQVHSIVGQFYRNVSTAITDLELGRIDALASEYPTMSIQRNLTDRMSIDYSTLTYECIVPNLRNTILRDHSVREALMYAIDRTTLGETVYTGMVQESEVPVVPGSWLYEPQAAKYNYNPERALQILYDAGWSDPAQQGLLQKEIDDVLRTLTLKLSYCDRGTTSTRTEAAQAIAAQLKRIGIDVQLDKCKSLSELHDNMGSGQFDLVLCAFELSEVPNLYFLAASSGDANYQRYNSGEMDNLLRTAYNAYPEDELVAAMSKVQLKFVNDLPILGLFFRMGVLTSRIPLSGLNTPRRGFVLGGIASASNQK